MNDLPALLIIIDRRCDLILDSLICGGRFKFGRLRKEIVEKQIPSGATRKLIHPILRQEMSKH